MALKKRIAVIGLGSIGRRHARLLAERDDLELELLDLDPKNVALMQETIGPRKVWATFEELLAGKPDLAVVATPHALHSRQTIALLDAGIDTLCEKPMSDSVAEAEKMRDAQARTSRMLVIGFNMRFHPCLTTMKSRIDSGAIGRILHMHSHIGTYITLVNSGSRYQSTIEGSLVMDYAHQPDTFYWLSSERPSHVYASAAQTGDLPLSAKPNFVMMNCEYPSGLLSTIHLNYVQEPSRHAYEIVGSEGWLTLEILDDKGILTMGTRKDSAVSTQIIPFIRDDMYRAEHRAFFDAVAGSRDPESPAASALVSVAVCDAAIRSWRTHERVRVLP